MCSTAILPIVGIVGTALGGFMQYRAGKQEAAAIESAGEARRALAYRNAQALRDDAAGEIAAGAEEAHREKLKALIAQGELLTGMGASGADVGSASFVNILLTNSMTGQENAANANRNAELRARTLKQQAEIARFEGDVDAFTAAQQAKGVRTSAKAGLLGSIGGVASKWSTWKDNSGAPKATYSKPYYGVITKTSTSGIRYGAGTTLPHGNPF